MLQRAASNAYSWWWASHIRTKQSKWLDSNLQEMEDIVKKMLKLIEADADSFAKRAELYFKRRPELISFVENAYRAYRALAERYDHISGELHKANHTIATACPDQVQYAMLEEDEDNLPKAITPIDPSKINKPLVEGLMKRRENESSIKKKQHKSGVPQINKEEAREEINKLQKEILVLQTEKEFIKSSYESGIAKYWEVEKQIMEMQEKVCCLQDEFGTGAVIEDEEARSLMTERALKSCEDAIVGVHEQRKKTMEQVKLESERLKTANEKLKTLKGEYCQSDNEKAEASVMSTQMSITAEKMEEDDNSLNKARLELQSICEKIKTHFEMNPENSVIEVAEKVNELVNKVIMLELTVSSQAIQINRLTSENNELDKSLHKLEEEKSTLINDSNALSKRLKEAEEKLSEVQGIEKIVQDEEINVLENFAETYRSLSGLSDKLQSPKTLEHDSTTDPSTWEQNSTFNNERQIVSQDKVEIHTTEELSDSQKDASQGEAGSQLHSASEKSEVRKNRNELGDGATSADSTIHQTNNEVILLAENGHTLSFQQSGLEGKENIPLAEYTSILQNYEETKRRLSETEHKNEEYLQETMALIGELKSAIAVKDEEIRLLRQQFAAIKTCSSVAIHASSVKDCYNGEQQPEGTSSSAMLTMNFEHQESETPEDLNVSTTTTKQQNVAFTDKQSSLAEGNNLDHINEPESISPIAEKFRKDIDALLDGNLEFWLRFSTSFHHIQEFKVKYEDMETDISKLRDNKTAEVNDTYNNDEARKSESARITTKLRELKTEVQVWFEQSALLGSELQSRISSLCELQEEITSATNTKSKSANGLFTPYHAAKFHGEVMNMKQENNKAASELQIGQNQVKKLQDEIELHLSKLGEKFEPFASKRSPDAHLEHSPSRTRVPLRVFLFGAKPKKLSFFQRIQPVFQKQSSKFRAGHQSKRFPQLEE